MDTRLSVPSQGVHLHPAPPQTLSRGRSVKTILNPISCSRIPPSRKGCIYIYISIMLTTRHLHYRGDGATSSPQMWSWDLIAHTYQYSVRAVCWHVTAVRAGPRIGHVCIFDTPILLPAHWDMAEDVALILRESSTLDRTLHEGWLHTWWDSYRWFVRPCAVWFGV